MVIYASVAKSRADQDATNANLSYYFLFHILHCSSQVAAVFRDWDENPASSNKKRSLPAAENQMEREEFGEEVLEIFFFNNFIWDTCLRCGSARWRVCLEPGSIVIATTA